MSARIADGSASSAAGSAGWPRPAPWPRAATGHAVRRECLARRQGGGAGGGGFRFDMGPTILTVPRVLRRIFAEAGRDMRRGPGPRPARSAVALLLRGRLAARPASQNRTRWRPTSTATRPARGGRATASSSTCPSGCTRSPSASSSGSVGGHRATRSTSRRTFSLRPCRDVLALRMGRTVAGTVRRHVPDARVAQMLDHFTQYVAPRPYASPAVLCGIAHMQTEGGRLVPDGRHPRRARGAGEARRGPRRRVPRRAPASAASSPRPGRSTGVETDRRRDGSRSPPSSPTWTPSGPTANCSAASRGAQRSSAAARTSRPAPASCSISGLDRAYDHLLHHNFVFSRDPEEEFDGDLPQGRAGPRPDLLRRAPARTEPGVAPPGGEALYVLVHTPYLRPHHDWRRMLPAYRRVILDKLARRPA